VPSRKRPKPNTRGLVTITFKMPKPYVDAIDELVEKGVLVSRSEFIRRAIICYLARFKQFINVDIHPILYATEAYSDEYAPLDYSDEGFDEGNELF